jgi:hypothetical protein
VKDSFVGFLESILGFTVSQLAVDCGNLDGDPSWLTHSRGRCG